MPSPISSLITLLDTIEGAASRYREHASRDATWVQNWTGEADPELQMIDGLINELIDHDISPEGVTLLLHRLWTMEQEPILAQAITEALLATPHAPLNTQLVARITTIVQATGSPPPKTMLWIAQALFWSAASLEDLSLCVIACDDAKTWLRALPLWLVTPPRDPSYAHLLTRDPLASITWIAELHGTLPPLGELPVEPLQGLALALGLTTHPHAHRLLTDVLTAQLDHHASPQAIEEPDVALGAVLEALAFISEPIALDDQLWRALLTTPAHGDACATLLARDGLCRVSMLDALLHDTIAQPETLTLRVRALRALRTMPSDVSVDRALMARAHDAMAPVRHTALYALVERRAPHILETLETLLMTHTDTLEAEELLFILSSHPSTEARALIQKLEHLALPSSLDGELFKEALDTWHKASTRT